LKISDWKKNLVVNLVTLEEAKMISLEQALKQIFASAKPLGTEIIALKNATNRVLAKPVMAKLNQPPFDVSAMDGYGVKASDVKSSGISLKVIGMSQAGAGFNGEIKSGECVRIFTGAPSPKGIDSVVMQEDTNANDEIITFRKPVNIGHHIRKKGQDFFERQELLNIGAILNPASIALCAASNNDKVEVYTKPSIAILATGDELVEPGSIVTSEKIISSNPYGLSALLEPLSENITNYPIAPDDEGELKKRLKAILNSEADIIITSGGASVGKYDFVQPTLKSLGVKMDFWKIAIRPGKPLMFGTYGKKLVFGLPGNPVSALVTAIIAVLPALRAILGYENPLGERMRLPLSSSLKSNGERRHFIRAVIETKENGSTIINPIGEMDSANLTSLSKANALIIHKENASELANGELVDIIKL
jgi:molybdopterin molybdotransferase